MFKIGDSVLICRTRDGHSKYPHNKLGTIIDFDPVREGKFVKVQVDGQMVMFNPFELDLPPDPLEHF